MKFILSRNEDYLSHSKKWMLGHALLFWLITRVVVMLIMGCCMTIYQNYGINPHALTSFGGDPTVTKASSSIIRAILMMALIAPMFEEILFRFGLSFKRISVATSLAFIPLFPAFSHNKTTSAYIWLICIVLAIIVFYCVFFFTSDKFWQNKKRQWQIPTIWLTSIAFGLVHLVAFSSLNVILLPYALSVILAPFFAGCACAYLRVNMGFEWGLAMHIFNNIPGIIIMLC